MVLLINHEIEGLYGHGHFAVVILHVFSLGLEQNLLDAILAEISDQLIMLRQTLVGAEERESAHLKQLVGCEGFLRGVLLAGGVELGNLLRIAALGSRNHIFSLDEILLGQTALGIDHFLDIGLELIKHLVVPLRHRT